MSRLCRVVLRIHSSHRHSAERAVEGGDSREWNEPYSKNRESASLGAYSVWLDIFTQSRGVYIVSIYSLLPLSLLLPSFCLSFTFRLALKPFKMSPPSL